MGKDEVERPKKSRGKFKQVSQSLRPKLSRKKARESGSSSEESSASSTTEETIDPPVLSRTISGGSLRITSTAQESSVATRLPASEGEFHSLSGGKNSPVKNLLALSGSPGASRHKPFLKDISWNSGHGWRYSAEDDDGDAQEISLEDRLRLVENIRTNIIGGEKEAIQGPFGLRRMTYADYTASGRSLTFIEDYLRRFVMPYYANTHTEASATGFQTGKFREEARELIAKSVGATEDDVVLFTGAGSTSAIKKMVEVLQICIPHNLDETYALSKHIPKEERPVIFVGPYEHHSNEVSWGETIAEKVVVNMDPVTSTIDLADLEAKLQQYMDRPLKIGSFSAASNVTGIVSNVGDVTALLHRYTALAFWDYAAGGPYLEINMNLSDESLYGHLKYKDAVFLSPHKFVGGPGTPGVLVAKRHLFNNTVPSTPGGGTVKWVTHNKWGYLDDIELREEGGTPDIIGSIRAGLVFQLKDAVGTDLIQELEEMWLQRALSVWNQNPNIKILGNLNVPRLPIISFLIKHKEKYLHHNFLTALLNDLFGIQTRGGCSCAGPYGATLLAIDGPTLEKFICAIEDGLEGVKPGWCRLNLGYFIGEHQCDFIIQAVDFVATHGWKFLPFYSFDLLSNEWQHVRAPTKLPSLFDIVYEGGMLENTGTMHTLPRGVLERHLKDAWLLLEEAVDSICVKKKKLKAKEPKLSRFKKWVKMKEIWWFWLPSEIYKEMYDVVDPSLLLC
ncbi:Selenocysteine lyase/cysteine desulfurase [Balamuthia mandrillaris]